MNKKEKSSLNKKKIRHKYEVDEILELIGLINADNNNQYEGKKDYQNKNEKSISQNKEIIVKNKEEIKVSKSNSNSKNLESININKINKEIPTISETSKGQFNKNLLNKSINLSNPKKAKSPNNCKYNEKIKPAYVNDNTQNIFNSFNIDPLNNKKIKNLEEKKNNISEINLKSDNEYNTSFNKDDKEILQIQINNSNINTDFNDNIIINDYIKKIKEIINNEGNININKGLVDKSYFHDKILNNNIKLTDFVIENVIGDGNCGYRALSLQIYNIQDNYNIVRTHIYNYLNNNKESYNTLYMVYNNEIITADLYIPKIKLDGVWMGDKEISVVHLIYDCILYLFEIDNNFVLKLINIYGNDNNVKKLVLNLCFINNNHYIVLYEKNLKVNILSDIKWFDKSYLTNEKQKILFNNEENNKYNKILNYTELTYANDNGRFKYKDVINYILKVNAGEELDRYPVFISNIIPKSKRKNLKKEFRKYCKKFSIDSKTNRLQQTIKIKDKFCNDIHKNYYITFINEKKNIIENLHEISCHRGINTLYNLVKEQDFIWKNIFYDLQAYTKNCPVCEQLHKNNYKKQLIKQILTNFPKERLCRFNRYR